MELEHCRALLGEPGQQGGPLGGPETLRTLQADNAALEGQVQELKDALQAATQQAQQLRMQVVPLEGCSAPTDVCMWAFNGHSMGF